MNRPSPGATTTAFMTSSPSLKHDGVPAQLRRGGEAMAAHDLGQLDPVRRSAGSRLNHRSGLAEILRTDRRGRDGTEGFHVLASMVVESVNRAARNAESLPWPDVDPGTI